MQDAENKADLYFLWPNRKRGGKGERPSKKKTTLFWGAPEMKGADNMVQSLNEMLACKEQAKLMRFPLDIQLFADDPQDPPADPSGDLQDPPSDPPADPPKQLTQKDIDDAIAAARAKWDAEQKEQQTEAQKLAKMTADEKKAYQEKKRLEDIEKREADLNKRELMTTAKETLISKSLPPELAAALDYKDADACNKSIDAIGKVFEEAVQKAVEDRIKGGKPIKKVTDNNKLTDEELIYQTMMGK